jgi:TolB protein
VEVSGLNRVLIILALCWAGVAQAEVVVYVTKASAEASPIAVVPFANIGAPQPVDVSGVVSADLERTGRFKAIPEADMLQKPTSGAEIDFSDWRILDTETLVVGQVRAVANNQYSIRFWVYDVFRRELLLGYQLTAPTSNMRVAAHQVADLIYEKLTGIKGIAATQIAYINVQGPPNNRKYRLYVSDADGQNDRILLESGQPIMSPAWSPDGRKLAYVSPAAGIGPAGYQQRACLVPGWQADGHGFVEGRRQSGNLHSGSCHQAADPADLLAIDRD